MRFLAASGMKYWQLCPLNPTSYGDSPYQSPSAFAGNLYSIDLQSLVGKELRHRRI
ncbi:MAG: 4-alpha-glucanotransferase [Puniceicoccales bacterium]|nr:4-alpha-glucanotransferase [Puniceicoccales bacterium]